MEFDQPDPYSFEATPPPGAPAGDPWTADELAQSQQWANQYYTSHQIPASYGTPDDLANSYVAQRRAGKSHADAMAYLQTVPGLLGWDKYGAAPTQTGDTATGGTDGTTTPAPAPAPATSGGSLVQPFTTPYVPAGSASSTPTPIVNQPLPSVADSVAQIPGAPTFPNIPRFTAPTMAEAMNDDGYKFVLDQGNNNLQNWAAARGTLNDSSTAKAMIDYGQGAATTQYGNVWDRALRGYEENVGTQYVQPWQAQYQNWLSGTVNPTMTNFATNASNVMQQNQTNAANTSHLNDVSWQDNWNRWLQDWNVFRDQRDSTFNKQFQVATA